jgi:toxin ParE1/3/4
MTSFSVKFTSLARADLRVAAEYLIREASSLSAAFSFLDAVDQRAALYASEPELGEDCSDLKQDLRRFVVKGHILFYRVATDVEIVRVIHGSRDIPAVLRREPLE